MSQFESSNKKNSSSTSSASRRHHSTNQNQRSQPDSRSYNKLLATDRDDSDMSYDDSNREDNSEDYDQIHDNIRYSDFGNDNRANNNLQHINPPTQFSMPPPPRFQINPNSYYAPYHGHNIDDLSNILQDMRSLNPDRQILFFSGDSSLDNKVWFPFGDYQAVNGYERVLRPPKMKPDVCYWVNREIEERRKRRNNDRNFNRYNISALNTAIEATALNSRCCNTLWQQDRFIRDNITSKDTLIVSVAGNDIALMPVCCTVINLLMLSWCIPTQCVDPEQWACSCPEYCCMDSTGFDPFCKIINKMSRFATGGSCEVCPRGLDLGCFGCGVPGCICSGFGILPLCHWPPPLGYFVDLFRYRVQSYIERILPQVGQSQSQSEQNSSTCQRPKKVMICMIYYLDESSTGSWADGALSAMGYNSKPERVQMAIKSLFELATKKIRIEGVEEVIGVGLFEALDGKDSRDYVARVEPSPEGGRKMGKLIVDKLCGKEEDNTVSVRPVSVGHSNKIDSLE